MLLLKQLFVLIIQMKHMHACMQAAVKDSFTDVILMHARIELYIVPKCVYIYMHKIVMPVCNGTEMHGSEVS